MGLFWSVTAPQRVVGLGMVGLRFEVFDGVQCAALLSRGQTCEHAGHRPASAPDVMMSRRADCSEGGSCL